MIITFSLLYIYGYFLIFIECSSFCFVSSLKQCSVERRSTCHCCQATLHHFTHLFAFFQTNRQPFKCQQTAGSWWWGNLGLILFLLFQSDYHRDHTGYLYVEKINMHKNGTLLKKKLKQGLDTLLFLLIIDKIQIR